MAWSHRTRACRSAASRGQATVESCRRTASENSRTSRRSGWARQKPSGYLLGDRFLPRGAGEARIKSSPFPAREGTVRLGRLCEVLSRQHRVRVLQCFGGVEAEAASLLGEDFQRSFELDEPAIDQRVERDAYHPVEGPHHTALAVGELDVEAKLGQQVEGRVHVLDLDLGLLAHLDSAHKLCRPLHSKHAVRPAIENPQPQGRSARRFAGPIEPVVLLLILALELGPALAKGGPDSRMVARAGDSKLQLAFDASITRTVMRTAWRHEWGVAVRSTPRFLS